MPYGKDPSELGCFWNKFDSRGRPFMTGVVNGVNVVVFQNTKKHDRQPDWRVMKSKPRTATVPSAPTPRHDVVQPPDDGDIPF